MSNHTRGQDLPPADDGDAFAVQFHLLGSVPFDDFLKLQRRLVYDAGGQLDGRITVLLCEHPQGITVGRLGSRGHVRLSGEQLRARRLDVRWVGRGGGCLLHGPGQIAVYPIVPLEWHGWSVGEYLDRLQQALRDMCDQLAVRHERRDRQPGIWGRSGQLACCGIAVRRWITCHGAYINVNPMMTHYSFVDVVDPLSAPRGQKTTMGSLFAERRRAMTIPKVRATLIPHLAAAFGTERYHLVTGHPLLKVNRRTRIDARNRAS